MTQHTPQFGTISHGTMRSVDLIEAFADELEWLGDNTDKPLITEARAWLETDETMEETGDDILEALFDALDAHAPAYCYFGAHEGDGSDYGFWPSWDSIDELQKFNDLAEVPADISDNYVIVNDHGNVSLYSSSGSLIWDCV